MNRKRGNLQAYFAGLFDGEGSVGIYMIDNAWRLTVQLRMIETLPVSLLWREYPEASLTKWVDARQAHYQPTYAFVLSTKAAYRFLKEIEPYVIAKRGQVKLALSFSAAWRQDIAQHGARPRSEAFKARAEKLSGKLKKLKVVGENGVNSVNAWPERSREYRAKLADAEQDVRVLLEKLEGVETRHRASQPIEAISAPEKDIVR